MSDVPAIDYTNKDFASLRRAMLDLARYRLPEWTDRTPADLGALLIDLFAYAGDVVLYYQDRIANENFVATAQERRSLVHLLRLVGYELAPPVAASADLVLSFPAPAGPALVAVPSGAQFRSTVPADAPQIFEYLGPDLTIDLASDQVRPGAAAGTVAFDLPVLHSRAVPTEVIGSSTGEPNQAFALTQAPAILESLVVEVQEGAEWITWDRRESLLFSTTTDGRIEPSAPDARDYVVRFDENGRAWVIVGDDTYGRIPPVGVNNIRATYRVGGGRIGNVAAGTIAVPVTNIASLAAVTNPTAAAGGEDAESNEHARRFGPQVFRSLQRAVTLDDYVALAHAAGGVAKLRARSAAWNVIELIVAPAGEVCGPVPEGLKNRLLAFFEDKRMAGTLVRILDADCVLIDVALSVVADARHQTDTVRQAVGDTVRHYLAYANVDFAQPLYLSDLYSLLEAVPGVLAVTITRFRRRDMIEQDLDGQLLAHNLPPVDCLPEFLQRALQVQINAEGRIAIRDYEIPALGELAIEMQVSGR